MIKHNYNWKRYWYLRGANPRLTAEGFLYNPESEWGEIYNPEAKTFDAISDTPCLVLLGEPGIGKSFEIKKQQEVFIKKNPNTHIIQADLGGFQSEDRLIRKIFENSDFQAWINGTHDLYLFLDSLDEGMLNVRVLSRILSNELKNVSNQARDRLFLRITCRSADWPLFLEDVFREIWGIEKIKVYQLAPLRQDDVIQAAHDNGADPQRFIREIFQKQITPLAVKPITLNFLLSAFKNATLPSNQTNLYWEGCRVMCEEDEKRTAVSFKETADAMQRMAIASRIAYICIFSNKNTVSIEKFIASDSGSINIRDLLIAGKKLTTDNLLWNEIAIREVLGTSLFITRGPNMYGWTHHSYTEFLAADYIAKSNMAQPQLESLIVHPYDGKIIPQLNQTVAWLAGMRKDVFELVLNLEPQLLLLSDISTSLNEEKATLVNALLIMFDQEKLLNLDIYNLPAYSKLDHPNLAQQIQPYLLDKSKNEIVRGEAIDFVAACQLKEFQSELADIILDQTESQELRVTSSYSLLRIADDDKTKLRLKPCLYYSKEQDPKDNLKGSALQLLWPNLIGAKELFEVLQPPRKSVYSGTYQQFLSSIVPNLKNEDLPIALQWIEKLPSEHQMPFRFFEVVDDIILKGWQYLLEPNVLQAFSHAVLSRFWYHDQPLSKQVKPESRLVLGDDVTKRQALFFSIIRDLSRPEFDFRLPSYNQSLLIRPEDVPWLLKVCESISDNNILNIIFRIINLIRNQDHFDLIFYATEKSDALKEFFLYDFELAIKGSPEIENAVRMRKENYQRNLEWIEKQNQNPLPFTSPAKYLDYWLKEGEAGNPKAWFQITLCLALKPDSQFYEYSYKADLTNLLGWQAASETTKTRIIKIAKKYILTKSDTPTEWLGITTHPDEAMAGFKALRLLYKFDIEFVEHLPFSVWVKWVTITAVYPSYESSEEESRLVALAYHNASDKFIKAIKTQLQLENKLGSINLLQRLTYCWDSILCKAVIGFSKRGKFNEHSIGIIVEELIDQNYEPAILYAKSLVSKIDSSHSLAVIGACALLSQSKDAGWSVVWPLMQTNKQFGNDILAKFVSRDDYDDPKILNKLSEEEIAEFYIWLATQYPPKKDPEYDDFHTVDLTESIIRYRDALLRFLRNKGSITACEAIKRISKALPEQKFLKKTLQEAKKNMRWNSWIPVIPEQLLQLAENNEKRLIQNGGQLLDVLLEMLQRIEDDLQGETASAQFLWDKVTDRKYRPKDENSFSDWIKKELNKNLVERGIIANREVEIFRTRGNSPGERTDIQINAFIQGENKGKIDVITAIIEVKGCWNPGLLTSMKNQLLDRYMVHSQTKYGIYLVGWFHCPQWQEKNANCTKHGYNLSTFKDRLIIEADELSVEGRQLKAAVIKAALR